MGSDLLRRLLGGAPGAASSRRRKRKSAVRVERLEDRLALTLLGQQLFLPNNAFNQDISAAPVALNSAAVISNIGATVHIHPDWGDDNPANGSDPLYGIPVNIVHADQITPVDVIIDNYPDESDIGKVPIPTNPVLEGDYQNGPNMNGGGGLDGQRGDSHLIIYDQDQKIAYELYGVSRPNDPTLFPDNDDNELPKTDTAWHAAQETIWDMKTNVFRTLGATSADAAGLSILAGLARPDEGLTVGQGGQGAINHALRLTLPRSAMNPQYIYPASHIVSDPQDTNRLPFGARLRLKNNSTINMMINNMPPESQIIARAMQQYGLIVADIGTAMYVTGASSTMGNVNLPNLKQVWDMNDILATSGIRALTAANFEVVDLTPQVTRLSASSGAPGSTITIDGLNFSGAAGRLSVFFGNNEVKGSAVTFVSDSQIRVVVPNGSGTVAITVQSGVVESGSNTNANVTKPIFGYGKSAASMVQFTFAVAGSTTLTWNGTGSGNWTDSKWTGTSTLAFPDAGVNAVVQTANTVTVSSPQSAYSLAVSGGGQVTVGTGASLTVGTTTSVTGGAVLNVAGNGSFTAAGTLTLDTGGSLTGGSIRAAAFHLNAGTASANLSGSGGLTKSGTGTVTLSGTNSYGGPTTVNAGTLVVATGAALPVGGVLVIGGTSSVHPTVTIAASDANGNPLGVAAVSASTDLASMLPTINPAASATSNSNVRAVDSRIAAVSPAQAAPSWPRQPSAGPVAALRPIDKSTAVQGWITRLTRDFLEASSPQRIRSSNHRPNAPGTLTSSLNFTAEGRAKSFIY